MAPIYREITLEWNGKTYTVTPTYALIQRLEQRLSLASLLERMMSRQPPLSQLADLTAMCLEAAGCRDKEATAENIFAELHDTSSVQGQRNVQALTVGATRILFALLPQKAPRGNSPAPATGGSGTSSGESTSRSQSDTSESNLPSFGG